MDRIITARLFRIVKINVTIFYIDTGSGSRSKLISMIGKNYIFLSFKTSIRIQTNFHDR